MLAFLYLSIYLSIYIYIIFIADNISISMYIMCVILRLFSALNRRVSALQISIITIIIIIKRYRDDILCNYEDDSVMYPDVLLLC